MITIAVFGPEQDQETAALAERLRSRGAQPWVMDLSLVPRQMTASFNTKGASIDGRPLLEADAAYLRRVPANLPAHLLYDCPLAQPEADAWTALHRASLDDLAAERSCVALRYALLEHLRHHRRLISPVTEQRLHALKWLELALLSRGEIPVPERAAGYDEERLALFCRAAIARGWSGVVAKPPAGVYKTKLWDERVQEDHPFEARPLFVQRYIHGHTVRCYVLAGRLLAAARIVHRGTVDSSESQTGIEPIALSSRGEGLAIRTAATLGLEFCGLDLMIDAESGQEHVIDCNISPMFVNFGFLSGCDIAGALADRLIALATEHKVHNRPAQQDTVETVKEMLSQDTELATRLRARLTRRVP